MASADLAAAGHESPLNRFYHPVLKSTALQQKPVRVQVAGTSIALFRDASGTAAAVLDRCPHRFAPLSAGSVKEGRLVCAYHGWNFDAQGCGRSPSQPSLRNCNAAALQVAEQLGYIWVAGPNVAAEALPEFHWPRFGFLDGMSIFFPAPLHVTLDNFGENEHTPFVHHRLGWNESQIPTLAFEGENHPDHTMSRYHARQRNSLVGMLVGLRPTDYFHNEYAVRFDPARLEHHIYWTNEDRTDTHDFQIRAVIYHVPETDRTTWVHVFTWLRTPEKPPFGGLLVPLVKRVLLRMVRREMIDDADFIPVVADVPNTTKGMRLGKYDATLVQNHRLLESIYWGRGRRETNGVQTNGHASNGDSTTPPRRSDEESREPAGATQAVVESAIDRFVRGPSSRESF